MKKLRLFDSLKFVVAVVTATFILNVAHADTSINSVIAYGKTEQSATPTPTNPVPIMTNNGVLKVNSQGQIYVDGLTETIRDSANHTATAQMLLGLNDTYRDEQNINTGAITRKVGVKVLDGTENWSKSSSRAGLFYSRLAFPNITVGDVLCTHMPYAANLTKGYIYSNNGELNFWTYFDDFTTTEQFKQWLAEQYAAGTPVIVVYPLATETTENVTAQTLTTAPVRQTAGSILGMPIEVVLGDGTREWVSEIITIATTRYNEEQFAPVKTDLSAAVNAVEYVVSNTMTQAQAIDQIANEKQTRPDEGCTAKYCLLVEDEDGTPHWYPIAGANGVAHTLPAGYTELQYIESTGTQYIDTGINKAKFIHDITFTVKNNTNLMGNNAAGGAYWGQSRNSIDGFELGSQKIYTNSLVRQKIIFDTNAAQTTLTANNETISYGNGVGRQTYYLFRINNASYYCSARLWGFEAYDQNDTLIQKLIPCKNSDNVVGMYDLVSGQFFTNAGTGEFTAGPDM